MSIATADQLMNTYRPVKALIIFKGSRQNDAYIEEHPIDENGVLGTGQPMPTQTLAGLARIARNKANERGNFGITPPQLMYYKNDVGTRKLIWYSEPQMRQMFFKGASVKSGQAPQPHILWVLENEELRLFALKEAPQMDFVNTLVNILHHAPYHNVSKDGLVCWGTAKIARHYNTSFEMAMEAIENSLYGSNFTHDGYNEPLWPKELTLDKFWSGMIEKKIETFPVDFLKPIKNEKALRTRLFS